jgi:hypothetical protein
VERLAGEAVLELEERRPVLLTGRRSGGRVVGGGEKVDKKQDGGGCGMGGATAEVGHLRLAALGQSAPSQSMGWGPGRRFVVERTGTQFLEKEGDACYSFLGGSFFRRSLLIAVVVDYSTFTRLPWSF